MDYIKKFSDIKLYKSRIRREKSMREEGDHGYYYSTWATMKRKFFVIKISFLLLFTNKLFLKNDFPYTKLTNKIKGLEHYVLWYKGDKPTFLVKQNKLFCVHKGKHKVLLDSVKNIEDFENYKYLKSIKNINHIQVFVLRKTS